MTVSMPTTQVEARSAPFDYLAHRGKGGDEAVSQPGVTLQLRRRARQDRPSAAQLAYALWDHLNDLVDDLDAGLLDTLMWRPDIGIGILTAGHLLMDLVPEVYSFMVRPAESDEGVEDVWVIAARVGLSPEEAFDRLNAFDAAWAGTLGRFETLDVIATIELA